LYTYYTCITLQHVQEILQEHAALVRKPVNVTPACVTTNHSNTHSNTLQVYRKIYCTSDTKNE